MKFFVSRERMDQFQKELESAYDEFMLFKLNQQIEAYNLELYDTAVGAVASSNPLPLLLQGVEVEQIRKTNDGQRMISLRSRNAIVTWSSVAEYIRSHNKLYNSGIADPFTALDYLLFNVYGANLVKTAIPDNYLGDLRRLIKLNDTLSRFLSNSNNALEYQLNVIFDIISDKCQIEVGTVKARKYNSKLIRMEFIKYSSLIQNLSVVDVDRLIDLILRQYIHVRTQGTITATSMMDIHKAQVPTFAEGAQAINLRSKNRLDEKTNEHYTIIQKTATTNPYFYSELSSNHRITRLGIDADYTIENIVDILSAPSMVTSMKLWNTLIAYGEHGNSKFSVCRHTSVGVITIESYCDTAIYAPNGSVPIRRSSSTLVYLLKRNAWIPNKSGEFFKPADIRLDELHNDIVFSNNNLLMQALDIGSNRE